jgi:hypothetical protein
MNNKILLFIICDGVPGTTQLISKILELGYSEEQLNIFFDNIIKNKIVGSRLYFVWKNNCNRNYDDLLIHNFDQYDDIYFYNKYEKYF